MLFLNILRILVLLHLKTPNVYDKKFSRITKTKQYCVALAPKSKRADSKSAARHIVQDIPKNRLTLRKHLRANLSLLGRLPSTRRDILLPTGL